MAFRQAHVAMNLKLNMLESFEPRNKTEIDDFIEQVLQNVGERVVSTALLCRYLAMTVYFAATKYLT